MLDRSVDVELTKFNHHVERRECRVVGQEKIRNICVLQIRNKFGGARDHFGTPVNYAVHVDQVAMPHDLTLLLSRANRSDWVFTSRGKWGSSGADGGTSLPRLRRCGYGHCSVS